MMRVTKCLLLLTAAFSTSAWAADNFVVKDANGTTITKGAKEIGGVQHDKNIIVDGTGTEVPFLETHAIPGSDASRATAVQGVSGGKPVPVSGAVSVTGAAANGAAVSGNPALIAGSDGTNARTLKATPTGVLASPDVGICDATGTQGCKITHTNLSADTATVICPATSGVITTMIYFTTADVGVSLVGGTSINSRTVNATSLSSSPTMNIANGGTLLTLPLGFTGPVSAYGAAGLISCTQLLAR